MIVLSLTETKAKAGDVDSVLAANALARRAYERYGFEPYEIMYEKRL